MSRTKTGTMALALGSIGVVFGDIGTSPLYAIRAVFGLAGQRLTTDQATIYGVASLIIWAVLLVVSIKYVLLVSRVDNKGEGGIMALVSIINAAGKPARRRTWLVLLGLIGMALFYGDSTITPAISVLSAVEGIQVVTPHLNSVVVPITVVVLIGLFWVQKYGTAAIGRLFGPVMVLWFLAIGLAGAGQVVQHPAVLQALSPHVAVLFASHNPAAAFVALGAVVLAITGAEALYADMGHFGRRPIALAWYWLVFPALVLCYLGQAALIAHQPTTISNPLFYLFPAGWRWPVVVLATAATLIASQSVISGAFSITRQAAHLNFLPKLRVWHTSNVETGQVYLPFVNYLLLAVVILLVILFGSSQKLANAYGIAVSGTLAIDTILFLAVLHYTGRYAARRLLLVGLLLVPIDILFVSSNLLKIVHGGWVPLLVALVVFLVATTWIRGQRIITAERHAQQTRLADLVAHIRQAPDIHRYAGQAVYIGHRPDYAPLALQTTLDEFHELPQTLLIISVQISNQAHIAEDQRVVFDNLGYDDGISQLKLTFGYHDSINIPRLLGELRGTSPELQIDLATTAYFISLYRVVSTKRHNLARWRKALYSFMLRNSLSPSDYYKLPLNRTQEVTSLLKL